MTDPRDVLVDRITTWTASEANVYGYADRLIVDLYDAGWELQPIGMLDHLVFKTLNAVLEELKQVDLPAIRPPAVMKAIAILEDALDDQVDLTQLDRPEINEALRKAATRRRRRIARSLWPDGG